MPLGFGGGQQIENEDQGKFQHLTPTSLLKKLRADINKVHLP